MTIVTEQFEALVEASQLHDQAARARVRGIIRQLEHVLRSRPGALKQKPPGSPFFRIQSHELGKNLPRFEFVFERALRGEYGAQYRRNGDEQSIEYMVLPMHAATMSNEDVAAFMLDVLKDRTGRNKFTHELIHLTDYQRAPGLARRTKRGRGVGHYDTGYYNDPAEFNAYYQAGADLVSKEVDRIEHAAGSGSKAAYLEFGFALGSNAYVFTSSRAERYWPAGFLHHLKPKTKRRFQKRVAMLWDHERKRLGLKQGLLLKLG